ncbi:MAG: amidase domain-containing protein [Oscillospiraceae bacterium]
MKTYDYRRDLAVAYAHRWAFGRNPKYLDFQGIGGDCTNFASQCIFAGSGAMNYTPTLGWYYINASSRTASWTGVEFLHNFLIKNKGQGPYAVITDISQIQPGDIIQLRFSGNVFQHSPVVVEIGEIPTIRNVLVTAHTFDADYRPIDSYPISEMRCIHILGFRK